MEGGKKAWRERGKEEGKEMRGKGKKNRGQEKN